MNNKKAVVLLSGGLDSTTTAAIAAYEGFSVYGLTFEYGQRHSEELNAASRVSKHLNISRHIILKIDLRRFGGSALTDDIKVPQDRSQECMSAEIPITYVPARNTIFLSFATAWAEVIGSQDIFIGVNRIDYSGYPDCRPEFINAYEVMANLATKAGISGQKLKIHTPLIDMTKADIIQVGLGLGIDYGLTFTCYSPIKESLEFDTMRSCGKCDACYLRLKGFADMGLSDLILYHTDI